MKRIHKLRWIGREEKVERLQIALSGVSTREPRAYRNAGDGLTCSPRP